MAETTLRKNANGYNYKYTDLAEIHSYLESKGWAYRQSIEVIDGNDYIVTTPIKDGKECEPIRGCRVVQATLKGTNNPAQEQGSALTYARRYSVLMAFGLCTTDDDASMLSTPKEAKLSKSELMDKVEALADAKSVPMEEIFDMAHINDLTELNENRLGKLLDWLAQQ